MGIYIDIKALAFFVTIILAVLGAAMLISNSRAGAECHKAQQAANAASSAAEVPKCK